MFLRRESIFGVDRDVVVFEMEKAVYEDKNVPGVTTLLAPAWIFWKALLEKRR